MASIKKRLDDLEQVCSGGGQVMAVRWPDDGDIVTISGTRERMSLAEFERRYPEGILLIIEYTDWNKVR